MKKEVRFDFNIKKQVDGIAIKLNDNTLWFPLCLLDNNGVESSSTIIVDEINICDIASDKEYYVNNMEL